MTSNNLKVNTNIFEIDRKQFKYSSNRLTDLKKNSNFHQIRPSSGQTYQPPPIQIEKDKPTNLRPINKKFDRISAPWEYIFKKNRLRAPGRRRPIASSSAFGGEPASKSDDKKPLDKLVLKPIDRSIDRIQDVGSGGKFVWFRKSYWF